MSFDLSRLRRGEWIVGAGSVVLLASMLVLPWYQVGSHTVTGWNALTTFRWFAIATSRALGGAAVLPGDPAGAGDRSHDERVRRVLWRDHRGAVL